MIELDFEPARITVEDQKLMNDMYSADDEMQHRKMVSEEYQRKRQEKLNKAGDITIE